MKSTLSEFRTKARLLMPVFTVILWLFFAYKGATGFTLVVFLILAGLAWYSYLTIPYEFETFQNKNIRFRTPYKTFTVQMDDIWEINARVWNKGVVHIKHSGGTVYLTRGMPCLSNLVKEIVENNPRVDMKGQI